MRFYGGISHVKLKLPNPEQKGYEGAPHPPAILSFRLVHRQRWGLLSWSPWPWWRRGSLRKRAWEKSGWLIPRGSLSRCVINLQTCVYHDPSWKNEDELWKFNSAHFFFWPFDVSTNGLNALGFHPQGRDHLTHEKERFAHEHPQMKKLEDVVRELKPTAIIGETQCSEEKKT